jgi:hypothetical protein
MSIERIDHEITERLRAVQDRIAAAETELHAAKQQRLELIEEAMHARWSHTQIGAVLGLTKQRIAQLRRP